MARIGLVYDLFEDYPWREGDPPDADAEYEPEETVIALEAAIDALGHVPVRVGTARDLLARFHNPGFDAAVNIAEGAGGRNREGYVPALLEAAGIPFIGSDALTLSLSLDKVWTKDLAATEGVPVPPHAVFRPGTVPERNWNALPFPVFVKPRYEGTAKGIQPSSKCADVEALRQEINRQHQWYGQDVLVEVFVEGAEYTVALIGNDPPEALPVLQRAVERETGIGLHALERKGVAQRDWNYDLPGKLDASLEAELQREAVAVYEKLECKDFARVDFRVDREGRPWFLEINPLPTFAPDGTFAVVAELTGRSYADFLADVLRRAFARIGF